MTSDDRTYKQERAAARRERAKARAEQKQARKETNSGVFMGSIGSGSVSGIGNIGSSADGKFFNEGITNINGGEFVEAYIEGICNSRGSIKVTEKLDVEGIFNCSNDVEANKFICEGTANIKGNMRVREADIEGVVKVDGRLEADRINCEGVIRVTEEISADLVEARGAVLAREVVGEKVVIRCETNRFWRKFLPGNDELDLIEATTIELRRVHAKVINGHDIRIGHKCRIGHVDCSGTLYIDPTAEVGEITGEYERLTS
jgi:cytoskeletal protein CcmA (bactofilin family)